MKKFTFLIILLSFLFYSCGDIYEEIHLKKDGSGTYIIYSDTEEMVGEFSSFFSMLDDSLKLSKEDSLNQELWAKYPSGIVDSTFALIDSENKDNFSIEEQEILEQGFNFIKGNKEEGYLYSGYQFNFKNCTDLSSFFNIIPNKEIKGNGMTSNLLEIVLEGGNYKYENRTFSRNYMLLDLKEELERKNEEENKEFQQMLQMFKFFFKGISLQSTVYLPAKVKAIKGYGLKKEEKKEILFKYNLIDLLNKKTNPNFEIKMKKK